MPDYTNIELLEKLEKWLNEEKDIYNRGSSTSIAESIHGEHTIDSVIRKLNQLKEAKDETKHSI